MSGPARRRVIDKRDRLRQLRAFCAAARLSSFARAAERLSTSPAAVALQVRELEHELEAPLFARGGGGIALNQAGERLLALAGPLTDAMEGLLEDFSARIEREVAGCVDVAASVAGAAFVLPAYVKRLRERHPGVRVRVRSGPLGEGLELLRTRAVELALGAHEAGEDDALEYREVCAYELVLITARNHPLARRGEVSAAEAARYPAVLPPPGTYGAEGAARVFGLEARTAVEVGGWGVVKRYVERGVGICVMPSVCLRETDEVSVVALTGQCARRSFGVYTRRGAALGAPARALLALLAPESGEAPRGARRR